MLVTQRPTQAATSRTPEPTTTPMVHVVEDETAIQALFRNMGRIGAFEVAAYATVADFLDRFDDSRQGCLVIDLNLPDGTGIEILEALAERECHMPVVFMSGMAKVSEAVQAFRMGSLDFVEKPFDLKVMLDAITNAVAADKARRATTAAHEQACMRLARLTPRERQVMELVVQGYANKEIAIALSLSHKTIEVHRANVMRKTEAGSVAELVRVHVASMG